METLQPIFFYALIGLAAFLVVGLIGLKIPAPLSWPYGEPTGDVEQRTLPDGLPTTVRQWLSGSTAGMPAPASLVAWGRGKIASRLPLIGRVWLPLSWTLYLLPGSGFVMQTRITWFRRRFIRGGEEYRDGKGVYLLGAESLQRPYLDETQRALAWIYFLWICPGSLIHLPYIQLQMDQDTATLSVNEPDMPPLALTIALNPSGTLQNIQTTRKGSVSGVDYPYVAAFSNPQPFDHLGLLPTQFSGAWDGELILKLELVGLQPNQDISEVMQTGVVGLQ